MRPRREDWFTPTASLCWPTLPPTLLSRVQVDGNIPPSHVTIYPQTTALYSRLSLALSLPCSTDIPHKPSALSNPSITTGTSSQVRPTHFSLPHSLCQTLLTPSHHMPIPTQHPDLPFLTSSLPSLLAFLPPHSSFCPF